MRDFVFRPAMVVAVGLAVVTAISTIPQSLLAQDQGKVGCRFYMDEVISLTKDRKGQVDSVISVNETVVAEMNKQLKGIDKYISSARTIARGSRASEQAHIALRFAETTKGTKTVTAELLRQTSKILESVSEGLASHMKILGLVRDKECPQ